MDAKDYLPSIFSTCFVPIVRLQSVLILFAKEEEGKSLHGMKVGLRSHTCLYQYPIPLVHGFKLL